MSYNSAAYLADRERLLEPDSIIIRGSQKWHKPIIVQHAKIAEPQPDYRTAEDIERMEDEYLNSKGVPVYKCPVCGSVNFDGNDCLDCSFDGDGA